MTQQAELLKKIDTLPPKYFGEVIDFVGYLEKKARKETISLEKAAEMAAEDYRNDKELTAFCALDGEDFLERTLP